MARLGPGVSAAAGVAPVRRLAGESECRALIVDDIEENRNVLRAFLEQMGLVVDEAVDGPQAVALTGSLQPDIVFMDVRMPGMDGIEAAEKIWADVGREAVKIVAVSASVLSHQRMRYAEAGFDGIVDKPVEPERIVACLQRVLGVPEWAGRLRQRVAEYDMQGVLALLDEMAG